jgi:hypothetical protein
MVGDDPETGFEEMGAPRVFRGTTFPPNGLLAQNRFRIRHNPSGKRHCERNSSQAFSTGRLNGRLRNLPFDIELDFRPTANGQGSSCHSGAGRERQEERGPSLSPSRLLLSEF